MHKLTRAEFNEAFAKELWDDEQEHRLYHLENRLHAEKMQLYSSEHVAGFHEGVIQQSNNQERAK